MNLTTRSRFIRAAVGGVVGGLALCALCAPVVRADTADDLEAGKNDAAQDAAGKGVEEVGKGMSKRADSLRGLERVGRATGDSALAGTSRVQADKLTSAAGIAKGGATLIGVADYSAAGAGALMGGDPAQAAAEVVSGVGKAVVVGGIAVVLTPATAAVGTTVAIGAGVALVGGAAWNRWVKPAIDRGAYHANLLYSYNAGDGADIYEKMKERGASDKDASYVAYVMASGGDISKAIRNVSKRIKKAQAAGGGSAGGAAAGKSAPASPPGGGSGKPGGTPKAGSTPTPTSSPRVTSGSAGAATGKGPVGAPPKVVTGKTTPTVVPPPPATSPRTPVTTASVPTPPTGGFGGTSGNTPSRQGVSRGGGSTGRRQTEGSGEGTRPSKQEQKVTKAEKTQMAKVQAPPQHAPVEPAEAKGPRNVYKGVVLGSDGSSAILENTEDENGKVISQTITQVDKNGNVIDVQTIPGGGAGESSPEGWSFIGSENIGVDQSGWAQGGALSPELQQQLEEERKNAENQPIGAPDPEVDRRIREAKVTSADVPEFDPTGGGTSAEVEGDYVVRKPEEFEAALTAAETDLKDLKEQQRQLREINNKIKAHEAADWSGGQDSYEAYHKERNRLYDERSAIVGKIAENMSYDEGLTAKEFPIWEPGKELDVLIAGRTRAYESILKEKEWSEWYSSNPQGFKEFSAWWNKKSSGQDLYDSNYDGVLAWEEVKYQWEEWQRELQSNSPEKALADMRAAEGEASKASTLVETEVLGGMISRRSEITAKKTDNGLAGMGANSELQRASNVGNETLNVAKQTRNQGGQEAIAIAAAGQQAVRIEQGKEKNPILEGIVDGIGAGMVKTGGHLGESLGNELGHEIFDDDDSDDIEVAQPVSGGDGGSAPTTVASSGGQPQPAKKSSSSGSSSGGGSGGGAAPCIFCGNPGYFDYPDCGWICHDCETAGKCDYTITAETGGGTDSGGGSGGGAAPCIFCGNPGYFDYPDCGWICHNCEASGKCDHTIVVQPAPEPAPPMPTDGGSHGFTSSSDLGSEDNIPPMIFSQ